MQGPSAIQSALARGVQTFHTRRNNAAAHSSAAVGGNMLLRGQDVPPSGLNQFKYTDDNVPFDYRPRDTTPDATTMNGVEDVNSRIPVTLAIDVRTYVSEDAHDCAAGFIRSRPTDGGESMLATEYEYRCLTRMNLFMRQQAATQSYGRQRTALHLMHDFSYVGAQVHRVVEDLSGVTGQMYQVFHMGLRGVLSNYWAACGAPGSSTAPVRPGCNLWLVWRRYCAHNDLEDALRVGKRARLAYTPHYDTSAPVVVDDENEENIMPSNNDATNNDDDTRYFWQLDPWVSYDRSDPPPSAYSGRDWIGDCIYIGYVLRILPGRVASVSYQRTLAQRVLYTQTDDEQYKSNLALLGTLEVYQRTK